MSTRSPCAMLQLLRGLRVDLDPAAPHRGRQRIGQLLQPRQVRRRAVVERLRGVGQEVERILSSRRRQTRGSRVPRLRPADCAELRTALLTVRAAVAGAAPTCATSSGRLPRQRDRRLQLAATSSSTSAVARVWCSGFIAGRPTSSPPRSRPTRARVDPRLEERMIRQDEIGEGARVVDEAAEADDERNLEQRLAHLPRRRRRNTPDSRRRASAPWPTRRVSATSHF